MPSCVMLRSSLVRGPSAKGLASSACWAAMKDFPEEKDASAEGAMDDAREPFLRVTNTCKSLLKLESFLFHFILGLTVWGVEPVVTHQTSWLESTGVCGGKPKLVEVQFDKESMAQLKAQGFETGG